MKVAVHSNVRTTIGAQQGGYTAAFNVAFRAGAVMGFALTSMAVLVLYAALHVYRQYFAESEVSLMMDCISGTLSTLCSMLRSCIAASCLRHHPIASAVEPDTVHSAYTW
jgi:Na+/H+-translocating membrane pyrophosphatase